MEECIFCNVLKNKENIISENEFFFSIYDRFPVSPGNSLVVSKRHVVSLSYLNKDEWGSLKDSIDKTIKTVENANLKHLYEKFIKNPLNDKSKSFAQRMLDHASIGKKPEGYNLGINEGEAAGRTINHFHLNIIPRFFGDMEGAQRGIKKIFPEFKYYND